MTAWRLSARRARTVSCSSAGKSPTRRPDRPRHVGRVERGDDEVPRLRRLEADVRRLAVAELADHDDVRVLAERRAERVGVARGVRPDLALDDEALAAREDELDRVLDRDDVQPLLLDDVVDERGDRRGLAVPGRARHADEPAAGVRDGADHGRQVQGVEVRDLERDGAHHRAPAPALLEDRGAEARDAGERVAPVHLAEVERR